MEASAGSVVLVTPDSGGGAVVSVGIMANDDNPPSVAVDRAATLELGGSALPGPWLVKVRGGTVCRLA